MRYIRTKDGIFDETKHRHTIRNGKVSIMGIFYEFTQADTIEELIQVGDIVFYWVQSDDQEHCEILIRESDIERVKYNTLTRLMIPIGEDFMCVAKASPVFVTIDNRRYLQMKKELKLL